MKQRADAERTSGGERLQPAQHQFESALWYELSSEELDSIHGGGVLNWLKSLFIFVEDLPPESPLPYEYYAEQVCHAGE